MTDDIPPPGKLATAPTRPIPPGQASCRGQLVAFRNDRLGARLLTMVNAMRIGADYDIPFAVYWPFAVDVTKVFNDPTELFESGFVARHFISKEEFVGLRPQALRIGDAVRRDADQLRSDCAGGKHVLVDQAFGINVFEGEDEDAVSIRFAAAFGQVPFSAALGGPMASVDQALSGATAYHIRRGDLTEGVQAMNKPWPHKMVPDEFYERQMARVLGDDTPAILFSDDAETLRHYTSRFPKLRTIRDVLDTDGLTEAQRDLIELYAMSRCETIIAPQRSAFSSTAANLSGARKMDVTECLTPEDREAAQQALFERLRDRPGSFAGDGEIGQSLAHIGQWLEESGRLAEAADLFSTRIASGLNISFIYPQTMGYQHRVGDVDGVIDTARHMQSRYVVHIKDQANAEILHGCAHLRRAVQPAPVGGTAEAHQSAIEPEACATGLRHIVNGFWHAPTVPGARSVVPFLLENGLLNGGNFLPSTTLLRNLLPRRGPLKALFVDHPDLVSMPGMVIPRHVGSLDPLTWDWAPLIRSLSYQAVVRRGTVARINDAIGKLPDDPGTAVERQSLIALYQSFADDPVAAADRLQDLARRSPDDAMVHQRLSHALRLSRDFHAAADAAERAVELAPDWPAVRAWAGMSFIRVRRLDEAIGHLRVAADLRIGLPTIHAILAEALQRNGDYADALAEIGVALELAPLEVDFNLRAARILDQNGRPEDAIGYLTPVVEAERAPAKLFILLVELLEKTGDAPMAAEMVRLAQRRSPDHPALADLAKRLAA